MKSYGIQQKISMKEKSPDNGEKEVTETKKCTGSLSQEANSSPRGPLGLSQQVDGTQSVCPAELQGCLLGGGTEISD